MVRTNTEVMARYQSVPGEPFIQTLEEVDGRYLALFEQHLNAHRYYSDLLSSFRIELNAFKGEERLDDWKIPNVNFVYINKLAPLGKISGLGPWTIFGDRLLHLQVVVPLATFRGLEIRILGR